MKKVCVLTGTRSDYGLLKPLLAEISGSTRLKLQMVVTGMHLLNRFGNSAEDVEKDGFVADAKLPVFFDRDSGEAMAKSIGKAITDFSNCFERIRPDIIVLLGDRMEAFAGAVAASCMNIPIAHLHGGDFAGGGLDEIFRPSITKFANIHFPATKKSAERIEKSGEQSWRIHVVGAPGIDSICAGNFPSRRETCKKFGLDEKMPIVLVVQHSVTTEPKNAAAQVKETMEAVKELGQQAVVIYPNSDAGGRQIIEVIERYRALPFIKIFKNLDHESFLGLMNCAGVMVGNSSSGIIESPSFGLPVVNIGTRQKGRERSANIIDVGHSKEEIKDAVEKALFDKRFIAYCRKCKSPYGDGNASKRIVRVLESVEISPALLQKRVI